jgi:RNA polymerase sigma-B factor
MYAQQDNPAAAAAAAAATVPERVVTTRDQYDDVPDMFRRLRALPAESHEFARQRDRIVTRCLDLADHIARRYAQRGERIDDLTQVARVGLMNAVNRFEPDSGSAFLAFAVPTITGEVRRHFRDHGWTLHVPRRLKDLQLQISRATGDLVQSLGRAPTASELAERLNADRDEIVEALVAGQAYSVQSIDMPIRGNDRESRFVADTLGDVDARMEHITNVEALRPLLAALTQRERTVLHLRFFASMTQSQIAEQIGVSQMHVSRILEQTLCKLRDHLA